MKYIIIRKCVIIYEWKILLYVIPSIYNTIQFLFKTNIAIQVSEKLDKYFTF